MRRLVAVSALVLMLLFPAGLALAIHKIPGISLEFYYDLRAIVSF